VQLRRSLVIIVALTLSYIGFTPANAAPRTDRAAIPILLYHHVADEAGVWYVSTQHFNDQMRYLNTQGFSSISMEQYLDHVQNDTLFPNQSVVLTFDDGYLDNYLYAFPVLRRYGLHATFFIIAERIGQPGYMTWPQIIEMQNAGMEIGAHTLTHPFLTKHSATVAFWEIAASRWAIFAHTNVLPSVFAYPYNDHNDQVVRLAQLAGYRAALIVSPHTGDTHGNLFRIPRLTIENGSGLHMFAFILQNGT